MDLLGTHRFSWEAVRRLAIECHALDSAAYSLLADSILDDKAGKIRVVYEELFTEKLLALAIGLRVKFYQGADPAETGRFANDCGLFYKLNGEDEQGPLGFTFKDVADKIIHANNIEKSVGTSSEAEITTLYGAESRHGKPVSWKLSLSVTLFTECVLNWVAAREAE